MSDSKKKSTKTVPYLPFKTVESFIERLNSTTTPPIIDGSLLQTMSGSMKSQLLSALRFLNLIDSNNRVQESMKKLVSSYKTDSWSDTLNDVIFEAYQDINNNVDLDSGTAQQLDNAFKINSNVDGQVLEKAVRFYLAALEACGIKYSPHFKVRRVRKLAPRKKAARKKKDETPEDNNQDQDELGFDELPTEMAKFRIPIPGKSDCIIALPLDLEKGDWEMVKIMLDAYVSRITKSNN